MKATCLLVLLVVGLFCSFAGQGTNNAFLLSNLHNPCALQSRAPFPTVGFFTALATLLNNSIAPNLFLSSNAFLPHAASPLSSSHTQCPRKLHPDLAFINLHYPGFCQKDP